MSVVPEIPEGIMALLQIGAKFKYKEMPNGEKRYSIALSSGVEWILTIAGPAGGWQNAHYHGGPDALVRVNEESGVPGVQEHSFVASGWMAYAYNATPGECLVEVDILRPGMSVTSIPGEEHNIYLLAGAVIHTIKFGEPVGNPNRGNNDWWPASQAFDEATKALSEDDLLPTED
jgi:hypothetical protein